MRIKKGEEKDVAREFSPSPCRPNLFITEGAWVGRNEEAVGDKVVRYR